VPQCVHISRRTQSLAVLTLALASSAALAQSSTQPIPRSPGNNPAPALRTLTTLRQAHSLTAEEARRGYPIHVRAVVTYYDPNVDSRRIALFLHDSTGSIYAAAPHGTTGPGRAPLPGTLVDVTGVSASGDFAPILDQARIAVIGNGQIPARAKSVTLPELLTGAQDGQWVQIEWVVHSVAESPTNVTLQVAMPDGIIAATTVRRPGVDYQHLVDKWVIIRGNAAPTFNANRQLTGCRLFFPGLETVSAFAPDSGDAFARPVQPVNGLLRYSPAIAWPHRVHVSGVVTMYWPGRTLCIDDGTEGLCAQTTQATPLDSGSLVDLAGFTTLDGFNPGLTDAIFRRWAGSRPVSAHSITPAQALDGSHDSELVQIEGLLIGRDLTSNDTVLILSSGRSVFRAILPAALAPTGLARIPIGSSLRVIGICSTQIDPHGTLEGYGAAQAARFWILARSAQDVVVLHTPSWWTASRIGLALLFTLMVTATGFAWAFSLRRRVEEQTRELRASRELYRHMAHHDELTGLPTRTLLQDRLQNALDRAQRFHKSIALLMLDLDRFKQINDCFGHDGGDHVLQITAERLAGLIRKTDSVARIGGDEFIVLLNDLASPEQAERIAEKVVAALGQPVLIGKLHVPVSVSIGVCTISDEAIEASVLLKRVDAAMYRAKERGRGCFQVFTSDMVAAVQTQPSGPVQIAAAPQSARLGTPVG
jgi:diguanylate cyclase (GGDEF)-like protein